MAASASSKLKATTIGIEVPKQGEELERLHANRNQFSTCANEAKGQPKWFDVSRILESGIGYDDYPAGNEPTHTSLSDDVENRSDGLQAF